MRKMILILMLSSLNLYAFKGVYELSVLNSKDEVIARGSSFILNNKFITSFHLLNSKIVEAERIVAKYNEEILDLTIVFYDEFYDILILTPYDNRKLEASFEISEECSSSLTGVGFYKGKLLAIELGSFEKTEINEVYRVNKYLRNGFSGGAIFNEKAKICGIIILSSELNSSSIAVGSSILEKAVNSANEIKDISQIRKEEGIEIEIKSQEEFDYLIKNRASDKQIVINLKYLKEKEFNILNTYNIVIKVDNFLNSLVVNNSENILIENLKTYNLEIEDSASVSVRNSIFYEDNALQITNSRDIFVDNNSFFNNKSAIVLNSIPRTEIAFKANRFKNSSNVLVSN